PPCTPPAAWPSTSPGSRRPSRSRTGCISTCAAPTWPRRPSRRSPSAPPGPTTSTTAASGRCCATPRVTSSASCALGPDHPARPMASATLRIRLLGELDLRRDEVAVPPHGSARAESLLAYLLLHREAPQPRQRLAFLLWPDSSDPQARTNLRHLLHNLRRALPDPDRFLEVTQRTLRW